MHSEKNFNYVCYFETLIAYNCGKSFDITLIVLFSIRTYSYY